MQESAGESLSLSEYPAAGFYKLLWMGPSSVLPCPPISGSRHLEALIELLVRRSTKEMTWASGSAQFAPRSPLDAAQVLR